MIPRFQGPRNTVYTGQFKGKSVAKIYIFISENIKLDTVHNPYQTKPYPISVGMIITTLLKQQRFQL